MFTTNTIDKFCIIAICTLGTFTVAANQAFIATAGADVAWLAFTTAHVVTVCTIGTFAFAVNQALIASLKANIAEFALTTAYIIAQTAFIGSTFQAFIANRAKIVLFT